MTLSSEVLKFSDSRQLGAGAVTAEQLRQRHRSRVVSCCPEDIAGDDRCGKKSVILHHPLTCPPVEIRHADGKNNEAPGRGGSSSGQSCRPPARQEKWEPSFPEPGLHMLCNTEPGPWRCVLWITKSWCFRKWHVCLHVTRVCEPAIHLQNLSSHLKSKKIFLHFPEYPPSDLETQ